MTPRTSESSRPSPSSNQHIHGLDTPFDQIPEEDRPFDLGLPGSSGVTVPYGISREKEELAGGVAREKSSPAPNPKPPADELLLEDVAIADQELLRYLRQTRPRFDELRLKRLRAMEAASASGHTHTEIGKVIGMSRSRVSHILAEGSSRSTDEELSRAWTPRGGTGQRRRS